MSLTGYLGIAKESTYGTPVTPDDRFIPILSESITPDSGGIFGEEIRGDRARHSAIEGGFSVGGDIEFQPTAENGLAEMIYATLGTYSTSGTVAPYTHTFSAATAVPSYTVDIGLGSTMYRRISGVKVNELSLSCAAGEQLSCTASVVGKRDTIRTASPLTATYGTLVPFVWAQGKVTIDGTVDANVENVEISIANNLVDDFYTLNETREIKALPEARREITGSLDISFENDTYYNWFLGGGTYPQDTPRFASLLVEFESWEASCGGTTFYLKIDIPKMRLSTSDVSLSGADRLVQSIDFDAIYDSSESKDIEMVLRNTQGGTY